MIVLVAQSYPTLCDPMDFSPLSMRFSRQEYWSGLLFPSPEGLPDAGIEPESPALAGGFFTAEPAGKTSLFYCSIKYVHICNQYHPLSLT